MPWFHVSKYFEKSGFVIAKTKPKRRRKCFKISYVSCFALQCKINLIEKDHW